MTGQIALAPDPYTYWRNALNGVFGPVHDGHAMPGFYKRRYKAKDGTVTWTAVALWEDADGMHAIEAGKTVDPDTVWVSCCQKPITEEVYRRVERGEGWPDAIESLIGDNNPPADEAEADEVESAVKRAEAEAAKPITNQTDADRLSNHKERLTKLWSKKEAERKAEKEPHLEAGRAVDAKFNPLLDKIKAAGTKVAASLTTWLRAEQARIDAENAKQTEIDKKAREEAAKANLPPPEPVKAPEPVRVKAGTSGRAVSLRTYTSAEITDYPKTLAAVADSPKIKEVVQSLANAAATAGIPLPGTEIKKEQRAA